MIRDVWVQKDASAYDHAEAVEMSLDRPEQPPIVVFGAPNIMGLSLQDDGRLPFVVGLCESAVSTSSLLVAFRRQAGERWSEAWTYQLDGVPEAVATRDDGWLAAAVVSAGTHQGGLRRTLHVIDPDGVAAVSPLRLSPEGSVLALLSYDVPGREGWVLLEREKGRCTLRTVVPNGATSPVLLEPGLSLERLLAAGDLVPQNPGDEVVVTLKASPAGKPKLAAVAISERQTRLLVDFGVLDAVSTRIVDIDGDGLQDVVGIERLDGQQQTAGAMPMRVFCAVMSGRGGPQIQRSGVYELGIASWDVADIDKDGLPEVLVGYERGAMEPQAFADVLSFRH